MATKTFYVLNTAAATPFFGGSLQEGGAAPTAANSTFGWTVAKTAITTAFWKARLGAATAATVAAATTTLTAAPAKGTGATNTTSGDAFRTPRTYSGTFANTAWTFAWNMRASVAGAIGRVRMRVWRSVNADGTSATEVTAGAQVGATVTLSTSADVNSSISWSPGSVTLTNEYLFFQVEWEETTAGSSTTANVLFRVGTASITTPDFAYTAAYDPSQMPSIAAWFDPQQGITLASGKVSAWNDASGYGVTSSQATASLQPAFFNDAVNGFPGIKTDRSAEWALSVSGLTTVTPCTLVSVCFADVIASGAQTFIASASAAGVQFRINTTGNLDVVRQQTTDVGQSTSSVAAKYAIVMMQFDATTYAFRINGVAAGSGSNAGGNAASGAPILFHNPGQTGEMWSQSVGDLIYTSVKSAQADIESAEGYLAWKYNLTQLLPSTHPYKNNPPGRTFVIVPPRAAKVKLRR